jgi:hypothetical protein
MGKARKGVFGPIQGRISNLVFYTLNGQQVVRIKGMRDDEPTLAVKINNMAWTILMDFFQLVKPFLKVGFANEGKGTRLNYHNIATSYNKLNAIKVINDWPFLDYEKLLLSKGTAMPPQNLAVEPVDAGLKFSWDYSETEHWESRTDQTMLMAYLPEENYAFYTTAGAQRKQQTDVLEIIPEYRNKIMEVYFAFVTEDRNNVSTSLYLGRLNS